MDIDFIARRHGVVLPEKVRSRTLLAQCEYVAKRSMRLANCEAYWLFVSCVTGLIKPKVCPVFGENFVSNELLLLISILMDFDETLLFTEEYEHRFDLLEGMFNVRVERPKLVSGGMVDNMAIMSHIAQSTGLPLEAVIVAHTLQWTSLMHFRPGAVEYVRQETAAGRIQIVSSSYPEIVAVRLTNQGHTVEWSDDLEYPFWVLPEGNVRIVGRHTDAILAKPDTAIPLRAVSLSGLPVKDQVSFEDSGSGEKASRDAGIPLGIQVGSRDLPTFQAGIKNFVGFKPIVLDCLWKGHVG